MDISNIEKLKIDRLAKKSGVSPGDRSSRRLWLWTIPGVLLLLGSFGYYRMFASGIPVETTTVALAYPSQAYTLLNATGYVVPQTKADVASKATGRLEKLEVEEGSRVEQGQVIARLEDKDVRAAMEQAAANVGLAEAELMQAEAELKFARVNLKRARALVEKRFISRDEVDLLISREEKAAAAVNSAKASIVAAQAAYAGARIAVDYTLIRAPFDGVILTKNADIGDVVAPFSSASNSKGAVVSMADMSTLEVEADVSESSLHKVEVGQPCEAQLDALPETRLRCIVHRIVPTVDRTRATVLVKVRFLDKDERILPDMSAKIAFLSKELAPEQRRPVAAVQAGAVVERDGTTSVYRVQGERALRVAIETKGNIEDMAVVTRGLAPGDRVVLHPSEQLKDGAKIKVQPG